MYKRGPKPPPLLWEKGAPANFKIPKILTEFSFGIGMVNTKKIPKGSYRNTELVCNSTLETTISISIRELYHGVTSSFFGIGILLVSDLLDFWYFGRYY